MNDILRDFLHKFVTIYLDDVCVFSRTQEEHMDHVRLAFQRLNEEGLKLRLKKFFFGLHELEYQSYTFSFNKGSRGRRRHASAYDAEGGSQFRGILETLRQFYESLSRPYGTIDGPTAEILATEIYVDACMFGSL
jgi:hypothetical protein